MPRTLSVSPMRTGTTGMEYSDTETKKTTDEVVRPSGKPVKTVRYRWPCVAQARRNYSRAQNGVCRGYMCRPSAQELQEPTANDPRINFVSPKRAGTTETPRIIKNQASCVAQARRNYSVGAIYRLDEILCHPSAQELQRRETRIIK